MLLVYTRACWAASRERGGLDGSSVWVEEDAVAFVSNHRVEIAGRIRILGHKIETGLTRRPLDGSDRFNELASELFRLIGDLRLGDHAAPFNIEGDGCRYGSDWRYRWVCEPLSIRQIVRQVMSIDDWEICEL